MAELLNCPFCNNDVNEDEGCFQVSGFRPPSTPAFAVRCGNPSCNAEATATSRESAIAAWNRRTPPPQAAGGEPVAVIDAGGFKNFHRSLCARFGYTHDEKFWWRDLVSLEEHIARQVSPPAIAFGVLQ